MTTIGGKAISHYLNQPCQFCQPIVRHKQYTDNNYHREWDETTYRCTKVGLPEEFTKDCTVIDCQLCRFAKEEK